MKIIERHERCEVTSFKTNSIQKAVGILHRNVLPETNNSMVFPISSLEGNEEIEAGFYSYWPLSELYLGGWNDESPKPFNLNSPPLLTPASFLAEKIILTRFFYPTSSINDILGASAKSLKLPPHRRRGRRRVTFVKNQTVSCPYQPSIPNIGFDSFIFKLILDRWPWPIIDTY